MAPKASRADGRSSIKRGSATAAAAAVVLGTGAAARRGSTDGDDGSPKAAGRAGPKLPAKAKKNNKGGSAAEKRQAEAATRIQRWYGGILRRRVARIQRQRLLQMREEEEEMRAAEARKAAAAEAAKKAKEEAAKKAAQEKEAKLRAQRDKRCTIEQMLQGLKSHTMPWEESPSALHELLSQPNAVGAMWKKWLGDEHETKKGARKKYLMLARKWHPDKWSLQGEHCVSVATDVTKCLVAAYDKAMKDLPSDREIISCEDEDEEREVFEFASWVGVAFEGMFETWKHRKGVTSGR
eukprot:TRINITY_DN110759_c0_g1_i1.p1 TRINITY_DN110759_c0_g1~~TRINITY_DN110759_c0_g1_i1.p1  ORF type:complete len:295 (-),score=107.26 TRINITY_DN110759_c0_g1_i1:39-923(-)